MKFVKQLVPILLLGQTLFVTTSSAYPKDSDVEKPGIVHAVTDLSHSFSFYADNRFHSQYLKDGKGATNWCNLYNYDFSNANLLVLLGCDDRVSYLPKDIKAIKKFVSSGGGVVILGSEGTKSQNELAEAFGVSFKGKTEQPLTYVDDSKVIGNNASALEINKKGWDVLVKDKNGAAVLAKKQFGKGQMLIGSRSIAGSHPNASDSINAKMWSPLLKQVASGKVVDPSKPHNSRGIGSLENKDDNETFVLSYNEYLKPFAADMLDISNRCMPFIEKRMGVPLSKGMGSEITLLATDGGGFSSGNVIALAVWWGGFPEKEDGMIEFITHESVHSWVLPYPEVWNEPIATYVGNLVMVDMGHEEEGMRRINAQVAAGLKHDPKMDKYDLSGNAIDGSAKLTGGAARDIHWGKTYWIFEELRKDYPDIVSRYFKTKREMVGNKKLKSYDMNNTVAVLSEAVGKDLFPWFKEHGFDVSKAKAEL